MDLCNTAPAILIAYGKIYAITPNYTNNVSIPSPGNRCECMVRIFRFAGVRPERSAAQNIAAVPYDVVTAEEARAIIARNPESFLRVSRPDAELPDISPTDDRIYERARENLLALESDGRLRKDQI